MTGSWQPNRVRFRFLLGEFSLFSFSFPLLVLDAHFTELEAGSSEVKLNLRELQPDVKGILIPSQPVRERLRRISVLADSIRYVPAQYQRFYVILQGSFSDYLKKFSPIQDIFQIIYSNIE